jgi:hypothetical protein
MDSTRNKATFIPASWVSVDLVKPLLMTSAETVMNPIIVNDSSIYNRKMPTMTNAAENTNSVIATAVTGAKRTVGPPGVPNTPIYHIWNGVKNENSDNHCCVYL